jgi:hypothetical protein
VASLLESPHDLCSGLDENGRSVCVASRKHIRSVSWFSGHGLSWGPSGGRLTLPNSRFTDLTRRIGFPLLAHFIQKSGSRRLIFCACKFASLVIGGPSVRISNRVMNMTVQPGTKTPAATKIRSKIGEGRNGRSVSGRQGHDNSIAKSALNALCPPRGGFEPWIALNVSFAKRRVCGRAQSSKHCAQSTRLPRRTACISS